jgi:HK97 family phage prohead protease
VRGFHHLTNKTVTDMLTRFLNTETQEVSDRIFRFKISDESVDRYGTVIKLSGWNLDNYNRNGIVAYQHITSAANPDYIVGKGKAWIENGFLYGEVEFEPEGDNPIADKIIKKLKFGSINATSVGFNPHQWSWGDHKMGEDPEILYFRSQDLLEFSIVNIPANPNAVMEKSLVDFITMAKDEKPIDEMHDFIERETPKQLDEITTLYLRTL